MVTVKFENNQALIAAKPAVTGLNEHIAASRATSIDEITPATDDK